MPKEVVTPRDGSYEIRVGWSQDRDVQVGVCAPDDRSILWILFKPEEVGQMVRAQVLETDREGYSDAALGQLLLNQLDVLSYNQYSGLWSSLERHDINRLIKILRKARDSAYGRDE